MTSPSLPGDVHQGKKATNSPKYDQGVAHVLSKAEGMGLDRHMFIMKSSAKRPDSLALNSCWDGEGVKIREHDRILR